jgi:hypothetical protein
MKTILQFKVDPDFLRDCTDVTDPVRIKITAPESIFISGILGESGRKMIADGAPFIFTRSLAEKLIKNGVAELLPDKPSHAVCANWAYIIAQVWLQGLKERH